MDQNKQIPTEKLENNDRWIERFEPFCLKALEWRNWRINQSFVVKTHTDMNEKFMINTGCIILISYKL